MYVPGFHYICTSNQNFYTMNTHEISSGQSAKQQVKDQLFEVVKVPLYTPPLGLFQETMGQRDAQALGSPHQYGIYKTSGGQCLGVAGEKMFPVQPADLLEAFTTCLEDVDVDLNKLTYTERRGGSRIEFSVPVPGLEFVNRVGLKDVTEMFLTVSTGFDGTSTKFRLDVKRLICMNGMTIVNSEFQATVRNTKHAAERIAFNCDEIVRTIEESSTAEEFIKAMNRKDFNGRQTEEFVNRIFNFDLALRDEVHTVTRKRMDAIMESMELEMSRTGASLWGALNGITHYTNHVVETKWDRSDYVMMGTGADINRRAQLVALELLS